MKKFNVVKQSGELEEFKPSKLLSSLKRAGANDDVANKIIQQISNDAFDGISTKKVYRLAFKMLNKEDKGTALRYSLKQAIYHLGPTGFPFEVYVSKLFENYGYKTKTNLNLKGKCISHEVDVIAEKGKEKILIECKFHSKPWIYSSIQTALYCYSRFMDINENPNLSKKYTKLLLVSSTKFSRDVRKYAKCKDIDVLGWGYPRKDSLQKMIEDKKLYPLTLLKSIDNNSKHILLENQYILLKDIIDAELEVLIEKTGIPSDKLKRMRKEALLV